MYEPIFLAKVREEITVKIPAGGWIILGSPDQPLHASIAARAELIKNGNVSDKFSALLIGRIQDISTPVKFMTTAEAKKAAGLEKSHQDSLSQSHQDALQREKDVAAKQQKSAEEIHAARVAEINRQNDAIRNRGGAPAVIETEPDLLPGKTAAEIRRDELFAMKREDLLALVEKMKAEGKTVTIAKSSKSGLIAGILTAEGITIEVPESE